MRFSVVSIRIIVYAGEQRFDIVLQSGIVRQCVRTGKVEQGIAVVKQRSRGQDCVGSVIDQYAEIAKVTVCIADHRVKDQHLIQRVHKFRPQLFIIPSDGFHTTPGNKMSDREVSVLLTGKKLAGGAEDTFPFR